MNWNSPRHITSQDSYIFITLIRMLLERCEQAPSANIKEYFAYLMFQWIACNTWFLKIHPNFHTTVIKKLNEFIEDPKASRIIKDFSWLGQHNLPYVTRYGRPVRKIKRYCLL